MRFRRLYGRAIPNVVSLEVSLELQDVVLLILTSSPAVIQVPTIKTDRIIVLCQIAFVLKAVKDSSGEMSCFAIFDSAIGHSTISNVVHGTISVRSALGRGYDIILIS